MRVSVAENRTIYIEQNYNTQNENEATTIQLQVPEKYQDYNKKIVFITDEGMVWDLFQNDEYVLKTAITKLKSVQFYIWLTKGDKDFKSQTRELVFIENDGEPSVTPEEVDGVKTVVALLDEEIEKVEGLEADVTQALSEVNTAIQQTNNINLDANKQDKTTTVELTKKDGTKKTVQIDDGVSLQFMWQGTRLGIKTDNQQQYTFVDLQGIQGERGEMGEPFTVKKTYPSVAEMNADFNNMQIGDYVMIASSVEIEDNAKLYTRGESAWIFISDFSGAMGIKGETGATPNIQIGTVVSGNAPSVTRTGTAENPILNFILEKGEKGDKGNTGETGATGNGIANIQKTGTSGLVDTYTITYTDGTTATFEVTNGEDGEVTQKQLDEVIAENEYLNSVIEQAFDEVSGTGENVTLGNTIKARFKKAPLPEGNTVQDSEATPTTPVEIQNVSGDVNVTLRKESNLVDYNGTPISLIKSTNRTISITPDNFPITLEAGTYTISLPDFVGQNISQNFGVQLVDSNGNSISMPFTNSSLKGTKQLTEDVIISRLWFFISNSDDENATVSFSKIMLNEGDTAKEWEEYQGQKLWLDLGGKNLYSGHTKGIGLVSGTGAEKTDSNAATTDFIPVDFAKNPNYVISGMPENLSNYAAAYNSNKEFLGRMGGYELNTRVLTASSFNSGTPQGTGNIAYIRNTIYETTVSTGTIDEVDNAEIQLEIGETPTRFSPYTANPVKLMEGSYCADDGFHHKREQVVLDGSSDEVWGYLEWEGANRFYATIQNVKVYSSSADNGQLCNSFAYDEQSTLTQGQEHRIGTFAQYRGTNRFYFIAEQASLNEFLAWLQSNPIIIECEADEEWKQPYTEHQQEQYEAIKKATSYKGTTHIYSTNELSPIFDATALRPIWDSAIGGEY